jgi:hypothetical protein
MSGYIGPQPVVEATQNRESFTAAANQNSFATAGYQVGYLDIFLNGVKLAPADYTATNGSDVVLAANAAAGDILEVTSYSAFSLVSPDFTGDTTAVNLTVTGNLEFSSLSGTGSVAVTDILDEDNMASNSPTKLSTQQAIKAYVDSSSGAGLPLSGGTMTGDIAFGDADKAIFGAGSNLEIFHEGNSLIRTTSGSQNLVIKSQATGYDLFLDSARDVLIRGVGGENGIKVIGNGAVELYHNNVKKIETTATGIDVTGAASADQLNSNNGKLFLDDNGSHNGVINAPASLFINFDSDNTSASESVVFGYDRDSTSGGTSVVTINSTGIDVTGTVTADGLIVDGGGLISNSATGNTLVISGSTAVNTGGNITLEGNTASDASQIKFKNGSTEVMRVAGGKVGIGTSTPSGRLSIEGATATSEQSHITFENTSGAKKFAIGGGKSGATNNGFAVVNVTDNTSPLFIDDSGTVLVGKTATTLSVAGAYISASGSVGVTRASDDCLTLNRTGNDGALASFYKDGSPVASIGVASGDITIDGASEHTGLRFEASAITPRHNGSASNSYVNLGSSSVTWENLYLDGGVVFGPASASNVSSQTLDDYEQGTYTPTVGPSSGTITLNTSYNTAAYTKVGRSVTITGLLVASAVSSPSGTLDISLPFASANLIDGAERSTNVVTFWCNGTGAPNGGVWYNAMLILNVGGVSYLRVYMQGYNGSYNVNPGDWIGSGSDIHVNFTYFTA